MTGDKQQRVSAVDTTVTILEVIQEQEIAGITEIAKTLGVSKANVHKHLMTLCDHGFARQEGDKYQLGYRFFEFGSDVRNDESLFQEAVSNLQELATITDEVATLLIRDGDEGVYIYSIDPERDSRPGPKEGVRAPLHETASGHAILSCLDGNEYETEVSGEVLRGEVSERLGTTDGQWVAITYEDIGQREIAAPITIANGEPIGAVALLVDVTQDVSEQVESNYTKLVKRTAQTVSKRMGIRNVKQTNQ